MVSHSRGHGKIDRSWSSSRASEGARLPAGDIYLHGRANTDRPLVRYTRRINVVVENRGLDDVFLFLAQGVPLLDECLRTPRALLSENIKKKEKEKRKGKKEGKMREEEKIEWGGRERERARAREERERERYDWINRWRATQRGDKEVGSRNHVWDSLDLETPRSSPRRAAQVVPTNVASSSSTGQKSKVKVPDSSSTLRRSPFHLQLRNRLPCGKAGCLRSSKL